MGFDIALYILLAFAFLVIYLVIKYPDRGIGTSSRPDLRGPKGLPILGNYLDGFRKSSTPNEDVCAMVKKYGPVFTMTFPFIKRYVFVNTPDILEHITKTKFENYIKGDFAHRYMEDVFGDGIFNVDGGQWKSQRKIMNHLFLGKTFRRDVSVVFEEKTKEACALLAKAADSGEVIDFHRLFHDFTLDTFGKICFGYDFGLLARSGRQNKFAEAFNTSQAIIVQRAYDPLWPTKEKFSAQGRRMHECCQIIDEFAYGIIKERRANSNTKSNDLLTFIMDTIDKDETPLSEKELRDILLNFIIAGRDTTAVALSWMLYKLMTNPEVEAALVKEINSMLTPDDPIPNYDNINKFRYANAVFMETLRLYPSVPRNRRVCVQDDILPGGIPIHAGTVLVFSAYVIGRDENVYGNDASEFNPTRFLSEDGIRPNLYNFPAFHSGPRTCLGQQFATVEALTLTMMMFKSFRFEYIPNKSPPTYAPSITLTMKDPLYVRVHHRN